MGLGPSGFQKFIYKLHSWFVPIFAVIWTIAMIKLWKWNVEGTGWWFAFAMVFLGIVVLTVSLLQTFYVDQTNRFFGNLINKVIGLFKRK